MAAGPHVFYQKLVLNGPHPSPSSTALDGSSNPSWGLLLIPIFPLPLPVPTLGHTEPSAEVRLAQHLQALRLASPSSPLKFHIGLAHSFIHSFIPWAHSQHQQGLAQRGCLVNGCESNASRPGNAVPGGSGGRSTGHSLDFDLPSCSKPGSVIPSPARDSTHLSLTGLQDTF